MRTVSEIFVSSICIALFPFIHELGHAFACLVTGGTVVELSYAYVLVRRCDMVACALGGIMATLFQGCAMLAFSVKAKCHAVSAIGVLLIIFAMMPSSDWGWIVI